MFSIIIPHFQGTVSDKELEACLDSVRSQRMDVEVLLLHDGPLDHEIPAYLFRKLNVRLTVTDKRYNDWGHSLRDIGIRQATREFIVHLNADNILYPKVLKKLKSIIKETPLPIYILPIVMRGVRTRPLKVGKYGGHEMIRTKRFEDRVILQGDPAPGVIDCMQLVMRTDLWKEYGWYDKVIHGDALMYEKFCKEHEWARVQLLLGEHR